MKKIIGAVALASLVVGFASADVKFALNYRTQMVAFSRLIKAPNNDTYKDIENQNYWFKQSKGWQDPSDSVNFSAAGDFGGVTLGLGPYSDTSGKIQLNQYNGYIKLGSVEVGAGSFKDGKYLSQYQVKNDSDAGWYQGDIYGTIKLGSLYSKVITSSVDNMVDFADSQAGYASGYATWKGDVGDAELTVTGSLIGFGDSGITWDEEATIYSGIGLQLNAKTDAFEGEFVFKTASNKSTSSFSVGGEQRALGLYVMPTLDGMKLVLGGAIGFDNGKLTEASADLRLRKAFGDTALTFYTNISHLTNDTDSSYTTGMSKEIGAEYLSSAGKATFVNSVFSNGTSQNYNTHMWNMLGIRSKLSDNFYFLFSTGDITSLRNVGTDHWSGSEFFVAPGFQLMNGKSGIATYFRFGMSNIGVKDYNKDSSENELSLLVPVVIRVRF